MALFQRQREIYLDYAASTPVRREVERAMAPYWGEIFANPFSRHSKGREAMNVVRDSRKKIASILGVKSSEIHFTSGATESNAIALRGVVEKEGAEGGNIILSEIEHASLQGVEEYAQKHAVEIRRVETTPEGIVNLEHLRRLVDEKTLLVSIVYVNSEIGTIQPLSEISRFLKKLPRPPLFHTDASQAPLWTSLSLNSIGVDMATFDAQKMYGPKGIGFLFVKSGVSLKNIFFSYKDGETLRPGTIPTALVVGCSVALECAERGKKERVKNITVLREYLIEALEKFDGAILNGSKKTRVANNVSVTFEGVNHEYLRTLLDTKGIMCSTGSACVSDEEEVRSVAALRTGQHEAVRFSFGEETKKRDIDSLITTLLAFREKGLL